ncbi:hypothetical protein PP_15 [Cyanophage PP]|uniref:Uncharacterized protein n=2 Tax=Wumptrevirus TaxID=2843476 RepID=A0AAE9TIW0_9CAUD|nr:hypothetical protein V420_gp15 [Cyanophage PP]AGY46482.1 hypothetical protein PP_15 [Cyanophage PP]UZV39979.1 hypothetical protein LPP2_g11 [Leptolyngbya phage LPP-2 st. SPI]
MARGEVDDNLPYWFVSSVRDRADWDSKYCLRFGLELWQLNEELDDVKQEQE